MSKLKKIGHWLDDRTGFSDTILPLLKHPVPPDAKWSYVFGSATLFCFLLQVLTGIGLALLYQPSSETAYQSLQFITHKAVMGNVLRGIHYFGASGMILMAGVHMVRVYLTASYKYPREMSWISGVFLLLFTITMGFTGQLLRWDSNGVWSSIVAAEQLGRVPFIGTTLARLLIGGDTLGAQSLSRFFAYHVFIFPGLIFLFVGFHLQQVIRNGISEPPKPGRLVDPKTYRQWYSNMLEKVGRPFWPDAAWRDALFGSLVILVIVALAVIFGPPELTKPPDPSIIYTTPTPDWYLLSIFALFALMPPSIESYVIFIGPVLAIGALIALPLLSNKGERSPRRRPWSVVVVICVVVFMISLLIAGFQAPWSPEFKPRPLAAAMQVPEQPVLKKGMVLFSDKGCLYCHRMHGVGGIKGPDLSTIGRNWTAEQLRIQIVNGSEGMPAYGGMLTNDELHALVVFLDARQ
ncbi:cytochrome b N-terminal domain-containing protein [Pontibacter sp. 172403-2]|uniref:cytochrome b N-terminal domain-containing protein n=1 Tax=Pontibacter rufus TaxID=2791028 RepID=UPI0018AFBB2B|nr:cytochrome b N-terminal domain-containing protein [Pontibacter sp. 172403-2]MBF9254042.1 cytochrome b N-terminal domain-containing protein [Pontibacter sp. 172403-2]